MNLQVTLTDYTTKARSTFGGNTIDVFCRATIGQEVYNITFNRSPITGGVQHVDCQEREDSTEDTLTPETVCNLVEHYLTNEL